MAGRPRLDHDVQLTVQFLIAEDPWAIAHWKSCLDRLGDLLPREPVPPPPDLRKEVLAGYGLDFSHSEIQFGGDLAIEAE